MTTHSILSVCMGDTVPYSFIRAPNFDARAGLKRCSLTGVGGSAPGTPIPTTDFWRNTSGSVMVRANMREAQFSFEVRLRSGNPIPEGQIEKFGMFVSKQLLNWALDLDDEPFEEIAFPALVVPPSNVFWLARMLVSWAQDSSRCPETLIELLPELGSRQNIEPIANAANFNACFCLLVDQIAEAKTKVKALQKAATTEIARKAAANQSKRLSALESQLMDFLADSGSKDSPIKAIEMTERESIMWDNDPHAGKANELV